MQNPWRPGIHSRPLQLPRHGAGNLLPQVGFRNQVRPITTGYHDLGFKLFRISSATPNTEEELDLTAGPWTLTVTNTPTYQGLVAVLDSLILENLADAIINDVVNFFFRLRLQKFIAQMTDPGGGPGTFGSTLKFVIGRITSGFGPVTWNNTPAHVASSITDDLVTWPSGGDGTDIGISVTKKIGSNINETITPSAVDQQCDLSNATEQAAYSGHKPAYSLNTWFSGKEIVSTKYFAISLIPLAGSQFDSVVTYFDLAERK